MASGSGRPTDTGAKRSQEAAAHRTPWNGGSEDQPRGQVPVGGRWRGWPWRATDVDGLGAANGSTERGAGSGVPTRKAVSRRASDAGPLTGGKGLTRGRGPVPEQGKRVTTWATLMRQGEGRARVGEEARGTDKEAEEGKGRALHRITPAIAREALQ